MQNGADPFIKDAEGLNAFQNIKNIKKRVIFTGSISHKENKIVSERLNNIVINSKGIIPLLEEINKKVINEMNDAANKKLYTNAAVSKYIKNPQYEFNDTYNSNKINNILKIGNKYYYILCVGVPSYVNGKTEYLDSYISVWEINGSLSISQISSMNAGRFVSGFNGIPLSDDINIVSKNQYLTIEDHANFEEKEYKYYTFVIDNDTFYLDRISLLDSRNNVHTLYLYSDKDTARLTMHDISYTLINSVLGINYYGIYK